LTVAVRCRRGVGAGTVARALTLSGLRVRSGPADIDVLVIAEVVKPEDAAWLAAAPRPTVVTLNKADLSGFTGGCPIDTARARCPDLAARVGAPVEPMAALLAVAALDPAVLDDGVVDALRVLCTEPADLSSPDAFIGSEHRLPRGERLRLAERLDLFGIAHAVLALRSGDTGAGEVRELLRSTSRIDEVCARIDAAAADVRYRRLHTALSELAALATHDAAVGAFLTSESTVLARMDAAVEVMCAAGLDEPDPPAGVRQRALRWHRYGSGPVNTLHRLCAADITRGSLRLLAGGQA